MHFNFQGNIYEQIKGVAIRSPLSPIVVYLYMEWLKNKSIESHCFNPKHWKVFIDDIYIVWPHGKEILHRFKGHLNNEVESIVFTMGMEDNNKILFLDILNYKKNDVHYPIKYIIRRLIQIGISILILITTLLKILT